MEETKTPSMTVHELDTFIKSLFDLRWEIEQEEEKIKEKNKVLNEMKAKAVLALKEHSRDSYKTEFGTIGITENWRVNVPADTEAKKAFFAHLATLGEEVLWKYTSVNSTSLNSFFNTEWDAAKEKGEGMSFKIPGIGEPKLYESLTMRKR